jgi:hypothetical protein
MKKKQETKNTKTREIDLEDGSPIKANEVDLSEKKSKDKSKSEKKSFIKSKSK